jgi:FkbM family methyltransferase
MKNFTSASDRLKSRQDSVSFDRLLLKEANGATVKDKLVLFSLKNMYCGLMVLGRIVLGKKKRDRLYIERGITYKGFLYKSFKLLGMHNLLLKVNVPEYGYQAYCRSKDTFNDLVVMALHERDLIERFSSKEGDVVIDIGAHIGYYTLLSSMRVGTNGKVFAIEADPSNFEMLNHNIKLNNLTNITALNYAVYSKETKIKLYLPGKESGCTIYNTVIVDRAKPEEKFVEVNANTLDNLLSQQSGISHADINWIKIDVEGAEFEVLKGATNILSKSKDIGLLIEIHSLPGGANFYVPIVEFLSSFNFKIEFENIYEGGERHIILRK